MKHAARWIILTLVIASGLGAGWWLGRSASTPETSKSEPPPTPRAPRTTVEMRPPSTKIGERPAHARLRDRDAEENGALSGQRSITFASSEARDRFLEAMQGKGIFLLGSLDALNTLRVGFLDPDALAALLDGSEETGYIYPVEIPGSGTIQDGALGFGGGLIPWIGAPDDRSGWGAGVRVAVLDTGIISHSAFENRLLSENLVSLPDDLSTQSGHGTAVGSLIASSLGLAPDTTLLSYRVANDDGQSDTFTLAQAVMAAADAGAHIINISMGSNGNSSILSQAVQYAQEANVLVVASSGNDGLDYVAYPAAYDGVVSVGAIDANGTHLDFSNSGNVTLTAPGLDVASAWVDEQTVLFSGTSASAPVVSGAIAALMSTLNIPAQSALDLLIANSNESGAPGTDPDYGSGVIDLGRTLRSDQSGIIDVALASNYVVSSDNQSETLQVTIENRGTSTVVNAPVTVTTPSGTVNLSISTLQAGDTKTFDIPLNPSAFPTGQEFRIESNVTLSDGAADLIPSNNRRIDVYLAPETP